MMERKLMEQFMLKVTIPHYEKTIKAVCGTPFGELIGML